MNKIGKVLTGILLLSMAAPWTYSAISEDKIADLFNGLADIIERNMTNPDNCISQLDDFINRNRTDFMEWKETVEANAAEAGSYPAAMGEADTTNAQDQMAASRAAQALNRWSQAISNFAMRNFDYMNEIDRVTDEISPRFEDWQ